MIEKAKLIYRKLEDWAQGMPAKRFKVLIITLWACVLVSFVFLVFSMVNKPSYDSGGLVTDNATFINLQTDYAHLQGSYEALAADYNNVRAILTSTIYDLEASKQFATAYETAFNELSQSYQAMSVAKQLLEASHQGLSQTSDVSQEFSSQYEALAILHKEKSVQYEDLLKKIDEVSDKGFFVVTDNFTQADMDSFYIGWDEWVESLKAEE